MKKFNLHFSLFIILISFQNCGTGFEGQSFQDLEKTSVSPIASESQISDDSDSAPIAPIINETPPETQPNSQPIVQPVQQPIAQPTPQPTPQPVEEPIRILNFNAVNKTETSAQIEWNLSESGNGQVEYGETTSLGESTIKELSFDGTFHRQSITNLKPDTTYYYKIKSYSDRGLLAPNSVNNFKTLKQAVALPPSEQPAAPIDTGESLLSKIPYQSQIAHPLNTQPATPRLPNIGEFIDMPGTNGKVEFTRITDAQTNTTLSHSYAKRSAVDPFNKYLLLNSQIYSLPTLKPYKRNILGYEYVPSMTQPDLFYGTKGNSLVSWNIVTNEQITIWNAPGGASEVTIGRWEGQQSFNDSHIVMAFKQNGQYQVASVDIKNKRQLGQISVDNSFNWADVSPSGKYVLVGTNSSKIMRYDINMKNRLILNTRHAGNGHADVLYDKQGNEVILQEGNFSNGDYSYVTLENNQLHTMDLVNTTGKVFISLQRKSGMSAMFAADITPGQNRVQLLGYTFTESNSYNSQAKATISSDGNTIVWNSDWMQGGNRFYTFLARIKK